MEMANRKGYFEMSIFDMWLLATLISAWIEIRLSRKWHRRWKNHALELDKLLREVVTCAKE